MLDFLYVLNYKKEETADAISRLTYSLKSIKNQNVNIIVSNNSDECIYDRIKDVCNIQYHHLPFDGIYNKSRCVNYAVRSFIKTDYFFLSDIDLVYPEDYIESMTHYLTKFEEGAVPKIISWSYPLSGETSSYDFKKLFSSAPSFAGDFSHNASLICLGGFNLLQGYNEDYEGYAPEDEEFNLRYALYSKHRSYCVVYAREIFAFHQAHKKLAPNYNEKNMASYKALEEKLIVESRRSVKIKVAGTQANKDLHWGFSPSMFNWMQDKADHLRYDFDLNKDSLVLDIGGYIGDWSKEIYNRYRCNILLFEPIKEFYLKAVEKLTTGVKISCFNFGIGDKTEAANIYSYGEDSSLYKKNEKPPLVVQLKSIIELIKEKDIKNIDLLKINVEGGEFPILLQLIESNLMPNIKDILIQFHVCYPDAADLRNKIRDKLLETHVCKFNYSWVWERWQLKEIKDGA